MKPPDPNDSVRTADVLHYWLSLSRAELEELLGAREPVCLAIAELKRFQEREPLVQELVAKINPDQPLDAGPSLSATWVHQWFRDAERLAQRVREFDAAAEQRFRKPLVPGAKSDTSDAKPVNASLSVRRLAESMYRGHASTLWASCTWESLTDEQRSGWLKKAARWACSDCGEFGGHTLACERSICEISQTAPKQPADCCCTQEFGDSDCPIHVTCSECGADISHQAVVRSRRELAAEVLRLRQLGLDGVDREERLRAELETERKCCVMRLKELSGLQAQLVTQREGFARQVASITETMDLMSAKLNRVEQLHVDLLNRSRAANLLRSVKSQSHAEAYKFAADELALALRSEP